MASEDALTAVAEFEVVAWDVQDDEGETGDGAALARTGISKRFAGALSGESVTHMLSAVSAVGRGYVAVERIDGTLDGRRAAPSSSSTAASPTALMPPRSATSSPAPPPAS